MPDILKIREALKRRSEALGVLQMTPPDSEDALREALVKTNRLREVFAETPDEASIGEMVAQIESLLADMAVWPAGIRAQSDWRHCSICKSSIRRQLFVPILMRSSPSSAPGRDPSTPSA